MENGVPEAADGVIPEGAIKKDWGWAKQVFQEDGVEIWLGYAAGPGKTSIHRHECYHQQVVPLTAHIRLNKFSGPNMSIELVAGQKWADAGVRHQLEFVSGGMFVETYVRDLDRKTSPPVVEDTLRETSSTELTIQEDPTRSVFAFG